MSQSTLTPALCLLSALAGGLVVSGAEAQDGRFELRSDNAIARMDPFLGDELEEGGARAFDLETGLDSNTWLRWVQPTGEGKVWRFETQGRVRVFEDRDDLNSVLLTPRVQYWHTSQDRDWQVRALASYGYMMRDGAMHWARPEAELQLRYRGIENRETILRARVNQYNFNDGRLPGLDQTRWRLGAEQIWRFETVSKDQLRLSAFYEVGDADENRHSFSEWRMAAEYQRALGEKTHLIARLDYRARDYDGVYSNALAVKRADQRWQGDVEIAHKLNDRVSVYGRAGYVENTSNIAVRDYDGAVVRFGFKVAL